MIIFSFCLYPERHEVAYAGNIELQQALQLLQQIAIADAAKKLREQERLAIERLEKAGESAEDISEPSEKK